VSDTDQVSVPDVEPAAQEQRAAETAQTPAPVPGSAPSQTPMARPAGPSLLGLPKTAAGWTAFVLEVLFVALLAVGMWLNSASMQTELWGRLGMVSDVMFVVTPVALLMSVVGGVLAISALARRRERSVLVWFAAAVFVLAVGVVVLSLV
jgi:hypothetical protein